MNNFRHNISIRKEKEVIRDKSPRLPEREQSRGAQRFREKQKIYSEGISPISNSQAGLRHRPPQQDTSHLRDYDMSLNRTKNASISLEKSAREDYRIGKQGSSPFSQKYDQIPFGKSNFRFLPLHSP